MATHFDLAERLGRAQAGARQANRTHGNPALARLVDTLGFDRVYQRGEGQYLWDSEGNRVLDCLAGYGALAIGRNHPVVRDALEQCLRLAPPSWVHFEHNALVGEAARMLKEHCGPGLDHVFFTNSGTEGVELAIKLSRRHTGRSEVIGWSDSFHGLTCGSLSMNGSEELQRGFGPLLPGASLVPFGSLQDLERALSSQAVAAFFIEPVQGKTLRTLAPGVLRDVQSLCRRYGTLLVADEVQTGVGRTGRFLATHHDEVQADIVVLSKALSGGFVPVGAVLARADVWQSTFSS
ncbi:MAG: aspartate aminotransferase family protein, partial [Phycisphaerae bacterium]|nr:aspartate aminotransferase family protein [Phycisphaerae bacterium]